MTTSPKRRKLSVDGDFAASQSSEEKLPPDSEHANHDQRRSLFIRSLAHSVTSDRLAEHFSQSYPIKHAVAVLDHETKSPKGYGFVTFADLADAQAALIEFDHSLLDGRKIRVELAESRHRENADGNGKNTVSAKAAELKAAREKRRSETAPPKLIVRNLPWSIKEPEDLASLFRSYGKVKHAVLPGRGPNVQAGFGFVVLRGRKNAEKALEGINGREVDGRKVAVDWAVDKKTWEELQHSEQSGKKSENSGDQHSEVASAGGDDSSFSDPEQAQDGEADLPDPEEPSSSERSVSPSASNLNDGHLEFCPGSGIEDEADDRTEDQSQSLEEAPTSTIFIRNLPYDTTDDTLFAHFRSFGPIRYARVVYDTPTGLAKGTGFVCFYDDSDAKACVRDAPKPSQPSASVAASAASKDKKRSASSSHNSLLQDTLLDPSGRYTLSSRILSVTRAVSKSHAEHLSSVAASTARENDKRHLYLLSEGTVPPSSALYKHLSPTELNIRTASFKQRQRLVKNNPSLHMSLTRLSVRNIPRSVGSKELKALAREAVVEFATEVKDGKRKGLSKEELNRDKGKKGDGDEGPVETGKGKKDKGKGIVKQAKIVFEGQEGGKVKEGSGAGRSRGYGFIEYRGHREALMGLRWLNGHAVHNSHGGGEPGKGEGGKKRLIVEFALENAQVVARRKDAERKSRLGAPPLKHTQHGRDNSRGRGDAANKSPVEARFTTARGSKRKRANSSAAGKSEANHDAPKPQPQETPSIGVDGDGDGEEARNKTAKRNRIIAKKRQMRKVRKGK